MPICVAYDVDGVRHDEMPMTQTDFHHATPVYEEMPGWFEDIRHCRTFDELPANAQAYVQRLEELAGARISVIGVGPGRDENVVINDLIDVSDRSGAPHALASSAASPCRAAGDCLAGQTVSSDFFPRCDGVVGGVGDQAVDAQRQQLPGLGRAASPMAAGASPRAGAAGRNAFSARSVQQKTASSARCASATSAAVDGDPAALVEGQQPVAAGADALRVGGDLPQPGGGDHAVAGGVVVDELDHPRAVVAEQRAQLAQHGGLEGLQR